MEAKAPYRRRRRLHNPELPLPRGAVSNVVFCMTTAEILERARKLAALVVGDICLDRWCTYDPAEAEPSRETGIPRVGVIATTTTPGAGGTVANNLAAMGVGRVAVLGVTGEDGFGHELRRGLEER